MNKIVIRFDELVDVEATINRLYASLRWGSLAFSSRSYEKYSVRDGGTEYWVNNKLVGVDTNSIGPYGTSDFWDCDFDEYGDYHVYSIEPPEVNVSMFVDGVYKCIVLRFGDEEVESKEPKPRAPRA